MSERVRVKAVYESDRSYVVATDDETPITTYYYADVETAEEPFTIAFGPFHGQEFYVSMTTPEFGDWLRALEQLLNDAVRDGR